MMRLALFIILIIQSGFLANHQQQGKSKDDPAPNLAAKAVLSGPDTKKPGAMCVLNIKGTTGKNFKVDCTPKSDGWFLVKFPNQLNASSFDDIGIIFSSDTKGTYTFVLCVTDGAGNLDIAFHNVVITDQSGPAPGPAPIPGPAPGPGPVPVPSDVDAQLLATLKPAYQTDVASGVGTDAQRATLSAIYKNAATVTANDKTLTKASQVWDVMRAASTAQLTAGALPNLRKALQATQQQMFPTLSQTTPLSDPVRADIGAKLTKLYKVLDALSAQ